MKFVIGLTGNIGSGTTCRQVDHQNRVGGSTNPPDHIIEFQATYTLQAGYTL